MYTIINWIFILFYNVVLISCTRYFFIFSSSIGIPPPATTQNGRVAGLVVSPFRFPKFIPKSVTSNPLSQIVTSNPRSQPDTDFAVDMFPYKKTELFRSLASDPNLRKSPEIRRFLALIYLFLTSILPSPHVCRLAYLDYPLSSPEYSGYGS